MLWAVIIVAVVVVWKRIETGGKAKI